MNYCVADMTANTAKKNRVLSLHSTYEEAAGKCAEHIQQDPGSIFEVLEKQTDGKWSWMENTFQPIHS